MDALITTEELAAILDNPEVKLLDGTYILSGAAQPETAHLRIGNAVPFDIDDIADPAAEYAHTMPDAALFAKKLGALGITETDHIIVYAQMNTGLAACRVWWMLRAFGHENVQILDGGLAKWLREGRTVSVGPAQPEPVEYKAVFHPELVYDAAKIEGCLQEKDTVLIDARDNLRFVEHGRIPGSVNLPFMSFLAEDGCFLPLETCRKMFADAGVLNVKNIVATCGSGVTACVLAFLLFRMGRKDVAVYDGSWTEWGACAHLPKEKGATTRGAATA
ncbi:MAG: sulfurtransferase [Alphaproteobacteria bacterium]|nr:MAG: sulfurtransferase [Alphaproteobacteria bacterium]